MGSCSINEDLIELVDKKLQGLSMGWIILPGMWISMRKLLVLYFNINTWDWLYVYIL